MRPCLKTKLRFQSHWWSPICSPVYYSVVTVLHISCFLFDSQMSCDESRLPGGAANLRSCDSNSRHMTVPTRNISNGATAQCLHLPSRTFFLLKRHVTMFIPSGKFTSSGSSQEGKQDFLDGGCTGWVESTISFTLLLVWPSACLPGPFSDIAAEWVYLKNNSSALLSVTPGLRQGSSAELFTKPKKA